MTNRICLCLSSVSGFIGVAACSALAAQGGELPTTAPTRMVYEMPMTRKAHFSPLGQKVNSECDELFHLMLDRDTILDPEKRKQLLVKVRPMLSQFQTDARQLAVENDNVSAMVQLADRVDRETVQRLDLLGDEETVRRLQADAAGVDPKKARAADVVLTQNAWTLSGGNQAKESEVVDALERLDRAHADSVELEELTAKLAGQTGNAGVHDRLVALVTTVMNAPEESPTVKAWKRIQAGDQNVQQKIGQPFTLSGATSDGKPFSSDQLKGKVILIDFWATWCGPCKALLPEIKGIYADEHAKGLEVVGVSNDYSLDALQKYTAANGMPWPQLIDASAMAKRTWNATTLDNGIGGIPRMFLIGRDGKLITNRVTSANLKALVAKALAD